MSKRAKCMSGSQVIQMIFNMSDTDEEEHSDDSGADSPVDELPSETEDHVSDGETNQSSDDDANEAAAPRHEDASVGLSTCAAESSRGWVRTRGRGTSRQQMEQRRSVQESPVRMKAKSGRSWTSQPPAVYRRGKEDIIRCKPGVTAEARIKTETEAFNLLMTPEIIDVIVRETNRYANNCHELWNSQHPERQKQWCPVSDAEIRTFIGLLILTGVSRAKLEPLHDLWSTERGRPIFAAVMSLNRFKIILQYIRFDNKNTREIRRAEDKLAAIRDVWQMFVAQLSKMVIPGSDITVDEQLVPFRGRCPFRQYIPSKPAKYGIKIWWSCDAETSYPLKGDIYLGRQAGDVRAMNLGSSVVTNLTDRWVHLGRNIVIYAATNQISQVS